MRYLFAVLPLLALSAAPAVAMDGVVVDTGDAVTVEDGASFSEGKTVAVFDADGNERDLQVTAVTPAADVTDVEFVDPDSGDTLTIEFVK